jgi:hypothetical protein
MRGEDAPLQLRRRADHARMQWAQIMVVVVNGMGRWCKWRFRSLDFFELSTVVGRATKGAASIKTFRGSQASFTTLKSHGIYSM